MSLKHAVLGLLTEQRSYGYEIFQRLSERLGPAWQLSQSAVYAALDQLEDDTLIREARRCRGATRDGKTKRRAGRVVYQATDEGVIAFRDWLTKSSHRREPIRGELQLKLALADRAHLPALLDAIGSEEWRLRGLYEQYTAASSAAPQGEFSALAAELVRAGALARLGAELDWLAASHAKLLEVIGEIQTPCR